MKFEIDLEEHQFGVPDCGVYEFEVVRALEQFSKKDIPMIRLVLKLKKDNETYWVIDYLSANAPWKIRNFLRAVSMDEVFETGQIKAEDCISQKGIVTVKLVDNDMFGTQAKIEGYGE